MSEPIQTIAQNNYILQAPPPTATMFTTELEYDGDKISGYAGSAFKAGTDLEFGYDSADNISAINNSAISQTPSQKLYLQSPLTTGVSGTSAYIGLLSADLARMLGVDETVLYSATGNNQSTITLNETPLNFHELKIYTRGTNWGPGTANKCNSNYFVDYDQFSTNYLVFQGVLQGGSTTGNQYFVGANYSGTSGTTWTRFLSYTKNLNATGNADWANTGFMSIYKVIGVGRKN